MLLKQFANNQVLGFNSGSRQRGFGTPSKLAVVEQNTQKGCTNILLKSSKEVVLNKFAAFRKNNTF